MRFIISAVLTIIYVFAGIILEDTKTIVHPACWAFYGYVFAIIQVGICVKR